MNTEAFHRLLCHLLSYARVRRRPPPSHPVDDSVTEAAFSCVVASSLAPTCEAVLGRRTSLPRSRRILPWPGPRRSAPQKNGAARCGLQLADVFVLYVLTDQRSSPLPSPRYPPVSVRLSSSCYMRSSSFVASAGRPFLRRAGRSIGRSVGHTQLPPFTPHDETFMCPAPADCRGLDAGPRHGTWPLNEHALMRQLSIRLRVCRSSAASSTCRGMVSCEWGREGASTTF